MAEYRPGDYDPLIVEEYEKYKFDAQEQGQPVMDIDEFLRMERAGVMGGGIMRNMYASGTKKKVFMIILLMHLMQERPYEIEDGYSR